MRKKSTVDYAGKRKTAGLTQAGIAKLAGLSVLTVCKFEHGRRVSPRTEKALQDAYRTAGMCSALGLDGRPGHVDKEWLRRQTESFLRANSLGIVEKEKIAHFVLSSERLYEYGRILLLAAGKNVD